MGPPAWLFPKSGMKISELKKRPFTFLKNAHDLHFRFAFLFNNKINKIAFYRFSDLKIIHPLPENCFR